MANTFPCKTRYGRAPIVDLELANKAYVDGAASGQSNTASNVGGKTGEVFKQKVGVDLELKTIGSSDSSVAITNNASDINLIALGVGMLIDSTESNNTPVTDDAATSSKDRRKYGPTFTMPTDFEFFVCTGLEWKNGGVSGSTLAGLDIVDAVSPLLSLTRNVAMCQPTTNTGSSSVQRVDPIFSELIPKGSLVSMWINADDDATQTYRKATGSSINREKIVTFLLSFVTFMNVAWGSTSNAMYSKIYFKGVGKPI